ncbi:hypothetical protein EYF80_022866 [Liparis tanakae]|uniref:Uncharacterized protein n=1 Tax=Liparis tanakae TaxID=230148 RepID=A0A4Z2HM30_9TELE|nr:hypothetical protein EYF80_022866 [Liparis tanakae]
MTPHGGAAAWYGERLAELEESNSTDVNEKLNTRTSPQQTPPRGGRALEEDLRDALHPPSKRGVFFTPLPRTPPGSRERTS